MKKLDLKQLIIETIKARTSSDNKRAHLKKVIKEFVYKVVNFDHTPTINKFRTKLEEVIGKEISVSPNASNSRIIFEGKAFNVELYPLYENCYNLVAIMFGSDRIVKKQINEEAVINFIKKDLKEATDSYVAKAFKKSKDGSKDRDIKNPKADKVETMSLDKGDDKKASDSDKMTDVSDKKKNTEDFGSEASGKKIIGKELTLKSDLKSPKKDKENSEKFIITLKECIREVLKESQQNIKWTKVGEKLGEPEEYVVYGKDGNICYQGVASVTDGDIKNLLPNTVQDIKISTDEECSEL